jgi:glycosyltransferase involved in cell wall biosynthesis
VGSLKYSPVYKSHCCAFGKACEEEGYDVKYLFGYGYEWMLPAEVKEKTVFVGNSVDLRSMVTDSLSGKNKKKIEEIFKDKPQAIYLHNYHFLNNYIAKLSKKRGCRFIYHVHEPHVANKKAHGGLHQYWLHLFEYWQGKLLQNTDIAVVSSKFASSLFDARYPNFSGKKLLIPLMFEDLGNSEIEANEREFVTFVGPPIPAKNPEMFLDIVDYAAEHRLDWSFLLVSRKKITDPKFLKKSNLSVYYKEHISDEEYGDLMGSSLLVLAPYKRETQSSVVLVSYMHGTPVVTSNVGGLPEFVKCRKTGDVVNASAPVEDWVKAIGRTLKEVQAMQVNCRRYFLDNFSGKNWRKYLDTALA